MDTEAFWWLAVFVGVTGFLCVGAWLYERRARREWLDTLKHDRAKQSWARMQGDTQ